MGKQLSVNEIVPRRRSRRSVARFALILGALSAFAPLSIDMYLPALPKLAAEFDSSQSLVQLTLTSCVVGLAVGQLFAGPLSDTLGRRRPLLVGLALFTLLSFACAFAGSVQLLIWLRLAQALAASAGLVIARAMVRDLFSGHAMARFFSVLMLVNGLAPILAPVFGGQLLRFTSWRGVFVVLAGIGVLLLATCAWLLPETLPTEQRSSGRFGATLRTYWSLLRDRGYIGYVLVAALSFAALFTYVSSSSFVLQQVYGLSPQQFSLVFGANSIGIVAFGQLNGRLVGRFEPTQLIKVGLVIAAVSGVTLLAVVLLGAGLPAVLIPLLFSVSSIGMILPNSATLALTNYPNAAGAASAMLGFGQFLIGGLIAPIVGLGGASALPMAATIAGMACAALLLGLTYARPPAGL
jgi:DHA1 family bicyclomycin/chloramphenicol resistance-like MFS transporter